MGIESSVGSSISTLSPAISSAPGLGGEFRSSFSFADTIPLSAPTEISLGGTFNPNFSFENNDSGSCQSPAPQISHYPNKGGAPLWGAPAPVTPHLELPIESDFAIDIPEVFKVGLADVNLDPNIPTPDVLDNRVADEDLLIPKPYSEAINVLDLPYIEAQNNIIEQINYSAESSQLGGSSGLVLTNPAADRGPVGLYPRPMSSSFDALRTAGTRRGTPASATPKNLILRLAPPAASNFIATSVEFAKTDEGKVEEEETEEEIEDETEGEEEKKKKKRELKFVVDEKALAERNSAFKKAVDETPAEIKNGVEIIDSSKTVAMMPTEVEKISIKSSILPPYEIELFGIEPGDGSYREATDQIRNLGKISRKDFYLKGYDIFRSLPPVAIEEDGEEVEEKDVERVKRSNPDPIRALRRIIVHYN